ncbi:MAG TPA: hypothetical protein VHA78_03565 [Candidatus Peribacteraceae bacterium]|nr:hypothetical protein [Candidatus Peribacteraceae bacterium]
MPNTQPIPASTEPPIVLMSWQAPSRPHVDHSRRWYTVSGTLLVIGAVYGILTGSWSLTIVLVLSGMMYFLLRNHVPPLKSISITDKGVLFEQRFVSWTDLAGFWILETPGYCELHIVPKKPRQPEMVILTGAMNLEQLRVTIAPHIPELLDKRESFLDALIRITKL